MAPRNPRRTRSSLLVTWLGGSIAIAGICVALLAVLIGAATPGNGCGEPGASGAVALGGPGSGRLVGATEYGGPGDPSSGTVGALGVSLLAHPDSYAELGGYP